MAGSHHAEPHAEAAAGTRPIPATKSAGAAMHIISSRGEPRTACPRGDRPAPRPTSVPVAELGVMMALEINTSQCRVVVAALTDAGFVVMRLVKVVGLSI